MQYRYWHLAMESGTILPISNTQLLSYALCMSLPLVCVIDHKASFFTISDEKKPVE